MTSVRSSEIINSRGQVFFNGRFNTNYCDIMLLSLFRVGRVFVLFLMTAVPLAAQQNWEQQLQWQLSPRGRLQQEADYRSAFTSSWNGRGTWMPLRILLRAPEGAGDAELRLNEEQNNRLAYLRQDNEIARGWSQRMMEEKPEHFMKLAMAAEMAVPRDDRLLERASDEQKKAYLDANTALLGLFVEDMNRDIQETLTPEQMLKVRALELQLMSELGMPFPSMFEPLDLSDAQKKEMNGITAQMHEEFEKLIAEGAALRGDRMKMVGELLKAVNAETAFASQEDYVKARQEAWKKADKDETLRQRRRELDARGRGFVTRLKLRLMNVLTDEQLDKMQALIDGAPKFVKDYLAERKREREAREKSDDWQPGPDSWRPGDGSPKEFKKDRREGKIEFPNAG